MAGGGGAPGAPLPGTLAGADTQDHQDPPASDASSLSCGGTQAFHHDCTSLVISWGPVWEGKGVLPLACDSSEGSKWALFFLFMNGLACSRTPGVNE